MLKKIIVSIFTVFAIPVFGMNTYENQFAASSTDKLSHIKNQMIALKRAWNSERLRIKIAQKASITSYQTLSPIFDKVMASTDFTTKLNNTVAHQVDAITNNNMPFNSMTKEFNISDFFPNLSMNEFGKQLFSAMAHKLYYLELGKMLAQKMQELRMVFTTLPVMNQE